MFTSSSLVINIAIAALYVPSVLALPGGTPRSAHHKRNPLKILVGNDDGWAEGNVRQVYSDLKESGNDVILSCPLFNGSGTGSLELLPLPNLLSPCPYNSVPHCTSPTGSDPSDPRLNYVNSFPVTAIKYGLNDLTKKFWNGSPPDIVVAGPNVGDNRGIKVLISGTVGVATAAAAAGIPGIAFSAANDTRHSFADNVPGDASHIYSALSIKLVNTLVASGKPYLPPGVALNVNLPLPTDQCNDASKFSFAMTKISPLAAGTKCNDVGIATEDDSANRACVVTISAMKNKLDVSTTVQAQVQAKLGSILSC
ncbi:hypothetical protein FRB99_005164 [Tulasnella sp. 403]|nr:hypothetical protein FRB99_005164 [Tulasnella sp. 403]